MIDLTPLIEFIEKQNKSLSDIPERLDKITEAQI